MKNSEATVLEVKQIAKKVLMSVHKPINFNLYMDYFMCS